LHQPYQHHHPRQRYEYWKMVGLLVPKQPWKANQVNAAD